MRSAILKRLFRRKISETSSVVQEDLRKIGLVLTAGGTFAIFFEGNYAGYLVLLFGIFTWVLGLTERRASDDDLDDT